MANHIRINNRVGSTLQVGGVYAEGAYYGSSLVYTPSFFDEDAITYIDAVESADGESLELDVRVAINNFVSGCKTDGIWDAIKASCILAGARTLNGALVPLVGPAPTNFNFVSADYDRVTGLVTDGATKYLDTNFAGDEVPQNSAHLSGYRTEGTAFSIYNRLANGSWAIDNEGSGFRAEVNGEGGGFNNISAVTKNGFQGATRDNSTTYGYRFNGTNGSFTRDSQAPIADTLVVFTRRNSGGSIDFTPSENGLRKSFYSAGEDIDLAALDARVSTLVTEIEAALT